MLRRTNTMGGLQHRFKKPAVAPLASAEPADRRGREQILRDAGAALTTAGDRPEIYEAGLAAAVALVADLPGAQVELLVGSARSLSVVAAAGVVRRDPLGAVPAQGFTLSAPQFVTTGVGTVPPLTLIPTVSAADLPSGATALMRNAG